MGSLPTQLRSLGPDPTISLANMRSVQKAFILVQSNIPSNASPFLVLTNVSENLAPELWKLLEARNPGYKLTSFLQQKIIHIRMPTSQHEGAVIWLSSQVARWRAAGILTVAEESELCYGGNPMIAMIQPPYRGSTKITDFAIEPFQSPHQLPTISMEVGWSESYPNLVANARLLLEGGAPHTRKVILIDLEDTRAGVKADFEIWQRDAAGIARCIGSWDIFPVPLPGTAQFQQAGQPSLLRGDIFGAYILANRNPLDNLPLNLTELRRRLTRHLLKTGHHPV
ncbi:hypothetical protein N7495_007823 [Penicillium taxi]|uniref:uncharacterized protein n=1 Tax=Penicillium taxi TaxID=168475 RepID=UPI0025453086|nr:uncharacterized protein N7495_007823 [Penicillium taxi]KAJ5887782.1 hypothetical protein N7495_007823 [Penicillium taxi]